MYKINTFEKEEANKWFTGLGSQTIIICSINNLARHCFLKISGFIFIRVL
jgi:hypothetical protein